MVERDHGCRRWTYRSIVSDKTHGGGEINTAGGIFSLLHSSALEGCVKFNQHRKDV